VDDCKKAGFESVVFTFKNHPKNLSDSKKVKQIVSWEEKVKIIESLGADYLVAIEFDNQLRKMSAEDFIINILIGRLNMKAAYCGFHYRFGYKALGTTDLLEEMGKQYGYSLNILEPVEVQDNLVSSTRIRQLIADGEMEACNQLLGRQYALEGEVVYGKQIGTQIGFPTANILIDETRIIPPNGVYITKCFVNNKEWNSITNIGCKPTVGGEQRLIETNIINFDENIYNQNIRIEFYKKIRGESKFKDVNALKEQIALDVDAVKTYHHIK
ncbi:MAG: bifunctional riboflavin kinase/FAD synthetase, partial [Clostridia bacterium]|nr:bifunctional riboflavin kinase/FAD synthetase [Clostridia bacterium]